MFDLVADVEAYPRFVPLCEQPGRPRARGRRASSEILVADMTVAYKVVRETFTTRVALDRPALTIDASISTGRSAISTAAGRSCRTAQGGCIVRFAIDYEFRSRMLAGVDGRGLRPRFRKFAEAFEARADAVYGSDKRALASPDALINGYRTPVGSAPPKEPRRMPSIERAGRAAGARDRRRPRSACHLHGGALPQRLPAVRHPADVRQDDPAAARRVAGGLVGGDGVLPGGCCSPAMPTRTG